MRSSARERGFPKKNEPPGFLGDSGVPCFHVVAKLAFAVPRGRDERLDSKPCATREVA